MDREAIAKLAKQAGWSGLYITWAEPTGKPDWSPVKESLTVPVTTGQIERFAALVADAIKEEDARICEGERVEEVGQGDHAYNWATKHCAAAIRASIKGVK